MPRRDAPTLEERPVFGTHFSSKTAQQHGPLVVLFARHPGSAVTRTALFALSEQFAALDEAEVSAVAILEGSLQVVRDFIPRYQLLFPVLHDPEGALYTAFGVPTASWLRPPRSVARAAGALRTGRRALTLAGGHVAAGFVLDRDHIVEEWVGRSPLDPPPVDALCSAALRLARPRTP